MKSRVIFFMFIIFFSLKISAQFDRGDFRPFFSYGLRYYYSTINNWQELPSTHLHSGIGATVAFQFRPFFYVEAASTVFLPHHSIPSFDNVHSWNQELNGNFVLPFGDETGCIRAFFGIAHLDWKGNYTGHGLNGSTPYVPGLLLKYQFLEGTIGLGFTKMIGDDFFIDFDIRMRVASEDNVYGLTETALHLGFRFAPQLKINTDDTETKKPKTESGMPGRKYKWLKRKSKR
jgi:hypothetical protein